MAASGYGKAEYWEERYKTDKERFDFYVDYTSLQPFLNSILNEESKILYIGCGNSLLPDQLYDAGFKNLTCIDTSSTVIEDMQTENSTSRPEIKYQVENALSMSFDSNMFDLVIDKGTCDAVLCGDKAFKNMRLLCSEVSRVLTETGCFISVSHSDEKYRRLHFTAREEYGWTFVTQSLTKPGSKQKYHLYVMQKKAKEEAQQPQEEEAEGEKEEKEEGDQPEGEGEPVEETAETEEEQPPQE
ncbi:putative kinase domain protein [Blattamonas nauphoetae]|uniref:Kinase domain protein n=1 Tax=Blattamonas nauphoetae TaxID=2049346 RepID=A0ABQ9XJY9_9EUKA|nr:putative kinase domain protein [Blattamonas nauphoetae]